MLQTYIAYRLIIATALTVLAAASASAHAVLNKRDSRAAFAWVAVIWMAPLVGATFYVLFGINRIQRRAARMRAEVLRYTPSESPFRHDSEALRSALPEEARHLDALAHLVDGVTRRPLEHGNTVEMLVDGDQAYPAMLEAIRSARRTVVLSSFIFAGDRAGKEFVDALSEAVTRGIQVRVIIDAVGARLSLPSAVGALAQARVPVARFAPMLRPLLMRYVNLRSHRKILVVDGVVGFTGGINIQNECVVGNSPRRIVHDLHFRLTGPVVRHLVECFAEDWAFCTGKSLDGGVWWPAPERSGPVVARGVTDGPDEDIDKTRQTIMGALACARRSVSIITPYFVPDASLVTTLTLAAMRGVEVRILLPEANNHATVKWASAALLWQVLERGCRVFMSPPQFDHSKLMVVDDAWTLLGSANWDARSLRLNFEFNVECYDAALARSAGEHFSRKLAAAREVTLAEMDGRSLPVRIRDGVARLLAPFL